LLAKAIKLAGDRLRLQLPNYCKNPIAVYGTASAVLVIVNTNPLLHHHEMAHLNLGIQEQKALIILEIFVHQLLKK